MSASQGDLRPLEWVADFDGVARLAAAIEAAGIVAIDTESNSFHAYFERVCLVQLATPDHDYLLDPLAVDPAPLSPVLGDRRIIKVFHAAENDVTALKRDFGLAIANLHDTMLAASILGWERRGLAALLETHFGIQQDKRFQKYNWAQRPLDADAVSYARGDASWLLPLRELQLVELEASGRRPVAEAAFRQLEGVEPRERKPSLEGWRKLRDVGLLTSKERGSLAALWVARDEIARELDRPAFKVLTESVLVYLARRAPSRLEDLARVRELNPALATRYGARLIEAVASGAAAGEPAPPRSENRYDEAASARLAALRSWRKEYGEKLGLPSEAVLPIHLLRALAQRPPGDRQALAAFEGMPAELLDREADRILQALATLPKRSSRMPRTRGRTGGPIRRTL